MTQDASGRALRSRLLTGYKSSWPGLARVGLWCLLFLAAFGYVVPQHLPESVPFEGPLARSNVTPVQSFPNDSRTVREDVSPGAKKTNIAWITDSGSLLAPAGTAMEAVRGGEMGFLPRLVAERLQGKKFGLTDVNIDLYLELGRRPFTTLLSALQAVDTKPQAIVISLNPVWLFSYYQFERARESLYRAPALLMPHPALWPLIPLFVAPSQDLLSLLGDHFRILREASPYKRYLLYGKNVVSDHDVDFLPWDASILWILPKAEPTPVMKAQPSRDLLPLLSGFSAAPAVDAFSLQAFEEMLKALRQSGIPTLIYASPLDSRFYADPETNDKLALITDYLATAAAELKDTNIRIVPALPEDVYKSITFIPDDGFHQWSAGKLDTWLAGQLIDLLDPSRPQKPAWTKMPPAR